MPSQPPRQQPQQQVQPFGASRDPFAVFEDMMSPFGGFGGGLGRRGGGLFGDIFGQMDDMMREMDAVTMGSGGQMSAMHQSGGNGVMMRGLGAGGGGSYSCQTFMFSSGAGADGKLRTERFASSAVGDYNGQMREVQQAYSNSSTGVDKMSMERQLEGRGRKMVKERSSITGEERTTDMLKGMTEDQSADFDQQWKQQAVPRLPQHMSGMQQYMLGGPGTSAHHGVGVQGSWAMQGRPATLPASSSQGGLFR